LLREAVVGLNDLAQTRARAGAAAAAPQPNGSNPLRTSSSVEQALVRLFESHGRLYGGPVEALRDVLQEAKDHETAVQAATQARRRCTREPAVAHQRRRPVRADPGTHARPRAGSAREVLEHYTEFFRVITQSRGEGAPLIYTEAFARVYAQTRDDLRAGRREREGGAS